MDLGNFGFRLFLFWLNFTARYAALIAFQLASRGDSSAKREKAGQFPFQLLYLLCLAALSQLKVDFLYIFQYFSLYSLILPIQATGAQALKPFFILEDKGFNFFAPVNIRENIVKKY